MVNNLITQYNSYDISINSKCSKTYRQQRQRWPTQTVFLHKAKWIRNASWILITDKHHNNKQKAYNKRATAIHTADKTHKKVILMMTFFRYFCVV